MENLDIQQEFVEQEKKLEYEENINNSNLNEEENLIVLDQVLVVTIGLQYSVK